MLCLCKNSSSKLESINQLNCKLLLKKATILLILFCQLQKHGFSYNFADEIKNNSSHKCRFTSSTKKPCCNEKFTQLQPLPEIFFLMKTEEESFLVQQKLAEQFKSQCSFLLQIHATEKFSSHCAIINPWNFYIPPLIS